MYRGSLEDVLRRYYDAAVLTKADVVVRITGDCALHSPDTIDDVVRYFLRSNYDYVCNTMPYSRPEGQDVEVFSSSALSQAEKFAELPYEREHVTPWIKSNDQFLASNFIHDGLDYSSYKWSVDYPDDLEHARKIWSALDLLDQPYHSFQSIMTIASNSRSSMGSSVINEGFYKSIFTEAQSSKAAPLILDKSIEWLNRSSKVIPGGAQTYSKSWRHHIRGVTPIFLENGDGALVTDVDGNVYVDLIQGLLPNILGYSHKEVNEAAYLQSMTGHSFSLPHPIEVKLAEKICEIVPCAEMVRFGKNGSDATAGAVRAARAFTNRDNVAVCGYHGWQDWYIGSTSRNAGVPSAVCDLTHSFNYNDIDSLRSLLNSRPNQFAAVILEPTNFYAPEDNFLQAVKDLTHEHGAILIFDEICSGFHFGLGGAQKIYDVTPDLATFGKALGNGWPISCICGRSEVMQIFEDAFVSFTFAGDISAMAAALKVIEILEETDAYQRMKLAGTQLVDGARVMANLAGFGPNMFSIDGHPHWSFFNFYDEQGNVDVAARSLWIQEVTRRGVLILTTFNICSALSGHRSKTYLKLLVTPSRSFNRRDRTM